MLSTPTTALVSYDPTFPAEADMDAYGARWRARMWWEALARLARHVVDGVKAAFDCLAAMVRDAVHFLADLGEQLQDAGMLPPEPTNMLCGQRWVSPIDGVKWRVAGQRGNRHWIEAGPRGWRRP